MSRVMLMTFFGDKRWDDDVHPHESPKLMTLPLIVLAGGAVLGGLLLINDGIVTWLAPVVGEEHHELPLPVLAYTAMTLTAVVVGFGIAYSMYAAREVPRVQPHGSVLTHAARSDLYQDTINETVLMRPGQWVTRFLVWLDNRGLDNVVNGLAALLGGTAGRVRRVQAGFVRSYALTMFGGATLTVLAVLVVRL
jgi:NADH-quinone oxidoreductase subunit L